MDKTWYKNDVLKHLSNTKVYKKVTSIPIENIKQQLTEIINTYKNEIGIKHTKYITQNISHFSIPNFYTIPKLKKTPIVGRPIISSITWITTPVSKYIDFILRPLCEQTLSYIKGTKHLIQLINNKNIQNNDILVTADVSSLYTNIPYTDAKTFILNALKKQNYNKRFIICILKLLTYIQNNNYFKFNNETYQQIDGTAMGTPMAPPFAHLYMDGLENILQTKCTEKNITFPNTYYRFLDDIFLIWTDTPEKLNTFIELFNNLHPNIKLTWSTSNTSVEFLDVIIYKNNTNIIQTKVHQKILNKYLYIPPTSCHPTPTINSWIGAEIKRYIIISSNIHDYINIKNKFYNRLIARGYNNHTLIKIMNKTYYKERNTLLYDQNYNKNNKILPFTSIFSTKNNYNKLKNIIKPNEHIQLFLPQVLLVFKRGRNLQDLLTSSKYMDE